MTGLEPENKSDRLLLLANITAALGYIAKASALTLPGMPGDRFRRLTAVEAELQQLRAELRKEVGLD